VKERQQHSIHPPRGRLIAFVEKRLDERAVGQVRKHLIDCEFCREFCDDYRLLQESMMAVAQKEPSPEATALADRLYREAIAGRIISLTILRLQAGDLSLPLAADGGHKPEPLPERAITLYSEDPEIVLRVMRGSQPSDNYLQLISEDPGLVSHVLVQAPQLGREFVTDDTGRVDLRDESLELTDELKWQIKMPDAVFDLEPLAYDPNKTEYSRQVILETEKQDKIEVTFEGKTEGKRLSLRVIALEGRTDFGKVTVLVDRQHSDVASGDPVVFDLADPDKTISIRLFTK